MVERLELFVQFFYQPTKRFQFSHRDQRILERTTNVIKNMTIIFNSYENFSFTHFSSHAVAQLLKLNGPLRTSALHKFICHSLRNIACLYANTTKASSFPRQWPRLKTKVLSLAWICLLIEVFAEWVNIHLVGKRSSYRKILYNSPRRLLSVPNYIQSLVSTVFRNAIVFFSPTKVDLEINSGRRRSGKTTKYRLFHQSARRRTNPSISVLRTK